MRYVSAYDAGSDEGVETRVEFQELELVSPPIADIINTPAMPLYAVCDAYATYFTDL